MRLKVSILKQLEITHYANPTVLGSKETRITAESLGSYYSSRKTSFKRNQLTTIYGYSVHIRSGPETEEVERPAEETTFWSLLRRC